MLILSIEHRYQKKCDAILLKFISEIRVGIEQPSTKIISVFDRFIYSRLILLLSLTIEEEGFVAWACLFFFDLDRIGHFLTAHT